MASEEEVHNHMIGTELARYAKSLGPDHPDRNKFVLESARLRAGLGRHDDDKSALDELEEYYEIPHDEIRERRRAHAEGKERFEEHCMKKWGEGPRDRT